MSTRLTIDLEDDDAIDLARLAAGASADPGKYVSSLISTFVRGQSIDGSTATEILRGIPGALERIERGSEQARRGEVTLIDEL